jgi:DNA-binding transcriptional MerR regulator
MTSGDKDPGAFRTIGELSTELGVAQHILRYWETKFPQLKPLQRAGNRRYYRPADVELARKIHRLLSGEGYTVRGVQQLLRGKGFATEAGLAAGTAPVAVEQPLPTGQLSPVSSAIPGLDYERLVALRDRLVSALAD